MALGISAAGNALAAYVRYGIGLVSLVSAAAYSLVHLAKPEKRAIDVMYDNGRGFAQMENTAPRSTPDAPVALNLVAHVLSVEGNTARINVETIPNIFVVGDSDGTFGGARLPSFAAVAGE